MEAHRLNGTVHIGQDNVICKDCGKSYNNMTNTPFSGSRYPEKWVKYIELMVEGYTLPKIAKRLKIHILTAFYWRHKILYALGSLDFNQLQGIVESDGTFFREWELLKSA